MSQTFSLAHLSDPHLGPLVRFGPRYWGVKRLLGYINWHRNRKGAHLRSVADSLAADVRAQNPDHIAVTGDLANIGLPEEHGRALVWLQRLGAPDHVSVVPGNHDVYVLMRRDPGVLRWREYMASNAEGAAFADATGTGEPATLESSFPYVRVFGRIAIIGVNSAVPMPPLIAAGRVGPGQLSRLGLVLDRLGQQRLVRVVLIHHPPLPGQAPRSRALADAGELERTLVQHGAELVLHGHNHTNTRRTLACRTAELPVIGIASVSLGLAHKHEPLARYNLLRITTQGSRHAIELIGRGLCAPNGPVVELERVWLGPVAPSDA